MILQYLAIFIGSALLVARAATSPTGLPHTGIPALHAVSDRRLRELMAQMNSLMFERFMAAPDIDHKRRIYAPKIADAADKLAATIDVIMLRLPALKLSSEQALDQIAATCSSCHALFRKLGN